jgi:hypothetical protein
VARLGEAVVAPLTALRFVILVGVGFWRVFLVVGVFWSWSDGDGEGVRFASKGSIVA